MTLIEITKAALIIPLLVFLAITGCANDRGHHRGRHQKPPVEAIEACVGKTDGSSVSFTGRNGDMVEARCQEINGQLVAVPEGADQPN